MALQRQIAAAQRTVEAAQTLLRSLLLEATIDDNDDT